MTERADDEIEVVDVVHADPNGWALAVRTEGSIGTVLVETEVLVVTALDR